MQAVTIDLWSWTLDVDAAELARLSALLSDDEQRRADRFVFEVHAGRYRAGRGRLREILAGYLTVAPSAVSFAYGANGKPALAEEFASENVHFNLGHTAGLASLAVCREFAVGLDVEFIRPVEDDVAKFHFSPAEYAALSGYSGRAWLDGFYRCWTRKEAMVKALGDGLSLPLNSFDVTLEPQKPARLLRLAGEPDAERTWSLHHFEPAAACFGAVAVRAGGRPTRVIDKLTLHGVTPGNNRGEQLRG